MKFILKRFCQCVYKITGGVIAVMLSFSAVSADFIAYHTDEAILIDGMNSEPAWQKATWYPLDKHILGIKPSSDDFSGRFRLLWDQEQLFLQVELTDDILFDQHANPLAFYWDDDCLEIFIDEDRSGGDHQTNFNAFAYHVALDGQAVDIGEPIIKNTPNFVLLNDHLTSRWQRQSQAPHNIIWEVALKVYPDTYAHPNVKNVQPVVLTKMKKIGFMLAYCDNDGSKERESFIGSTNIKAVKGDKNLGYKTADVFGTLVLH